MPIPRLTLISAALLLAAPRGRAQLADGAAARAHSREPSAATRPDTVSFASGALTLRGIVYRPSGAGPFTAILFNHGSGKDYSAEVAAVGPAYAAQGFVFFAPSRRGQWLSSSTGHYIIDSLDAVERSGGKAARDTLLVTLMRGEQLDDVRAALAWLRRDRSVRRDRVVIAGNSFGGIVTVLASANVRGLYAALNFAGAAQTWAGSPVLQSAMTEDATQARIPIFFGQAENDYDLTPSRSLSAAMTAAGKPNVLKIFPAFGRTTAEGHSFGYFGSSIWGPIVRQFIDDPTGGGTRSGSKGRSG